jgi:hypothetical protein
MSTNRLRASVLVALGGALLGSTAAATGPGTAEIRQVGATAVVYRGPVVNVVLSYRFSKLNPQGAWLVLDTVMTATSEPLEVPRTAIAVRTPAGEVVPLASQKQFADAYVELGAIILRANATREPMAYLPPHRYRPLRLFSEVGHSLTYSSVWLDEWHNELGHLYFHLPSGIQHGNYELLFALKNGEVLIPFTIYKSHGKRRTARRAALLKQSVRGFR